jgi:hypothetical protein
MPRRVNPGSINTGPGKTVPGDSDNLVLYGDGMSGAGPNIGEPGHIPPGGSAEAGWPSPFIEGGGGSGLEMLKIHLEDPKNAHPAIAISIDGYPPLVLSKNVEGALDELMANIPPEPPKIGQYKPYLTLSGIPDWGNRRLDDGPLAVHTDIGSSETGANVYPYYWTAPTPTQDAVFTTLGNDPITDTLWNGPQVIPVIAGLPTGVAGAFTNSSSEVVRSRVFGVADDDGETITNLSGAIYPADRGVLALLNWPAGATTSAQFLAQDLLDRCWGALLLGQGIMGGQQCIKTVDDAVELCDGDPGGIFAQGTTDSHYDPFAYPGRATGQYDLLELHTGVSGIDGTALPAPWDSGIPRVLNSETPGAGQVRLGTDPLASPTLIEPYGIPILGAAADAYSPEPEDTILDDSYTYVGHMALTDGNFLRYRLPYLKDYTATTGLKFTPKGTDIYTTREAARYFEVASPYDAASSDIQSVGGTDELLQAGNYPNFDEDYWVWQLARMRQLIWRGPDPAGTELGTLWYVHFKTEKDFESCVRDGVMPWDATNGYEVYGMQIAGIPPLVSNLVNTDTGVLATDFPAPDYGYGAASYHTLRTEGFIADYETLPTSTTATWTYTLPGAGSPGLVYISGVCYFTPLTTAGVQSFQISDLDAVFSDAWTDGYRTDDNPLTDDAVPVAPTVLSGANPAFMTLSPFTYGAESGVPTFDIPAALTDARGLRLQRVEFPYTLLGSNGGGDFAADNGPEAADDLEVHLVGTIDPTGDKSSVGFSADAAPRFFIRRPWIVDPIQPVSGTSLGTKLLLAGSPTHKVLFHSGYFDESEGSYGNYVDGSDRAFDCLLTEIKDSYEPFLDEVYRVVSGWNNDVGTAEEPLVGPGMQGWVGDPIPVPVRMGKLTPYDGTIEDTWKTSSFLHEALHMDDLPADELQVAGLPERNPPATNWVTAPFPSAGLLGYPQADYSDSYRPRDAETGYVQPDYSAETGTKTFVRCFDAAFSHSDTFRADVAGQPFFILRLEGLTLADFQYEAPGPGKFNDANIGIAISVKIPGLTTWMDLGRADGDGPSKQDNGLDGAGCQVTGPYTYTGVDSTTGMVFSQVQVHVGPDVALAQGASFDDEGTTRYEVPVLVKVTMNETAADYNLTKPATGVGTFGAASVSALAHEVRGLTTIQVIAPVRWTALTEAMATLYDSLLG